MNRASSIVPLLFAAALAACGDDDASRVDADTTTTTDTTTSTDGTSGDITADVDPDTSDATTTDATTTSDATDASDVPSGPILAHDRYGTRLWGAILGLSITGSGAERQLWIGQRGNPDYMDRTETPPIRAGLVRLTIESGEVKTFGDELGTEDYAFAGYPGLFGPVATAGVQPDGDRVVVVSHTGLLAIEDDAVTPFTVHLPGDGPAVVPINLAIARDGLRPVAWLTSDQGLLRLDEDSFLVEDVTTSADVGLDGDFGKLAVDPDTGTVFATFFPSDASPTRLVSVTVTGVTTVLVPGQGGLPAGRVGDLAWSATDGGVYVALGAWDADDGGVLFWDGVATAPGPGARALVDEGDLGDGEVFGAQTLALDDTLRVLAVGGHLLGNPVASPKGGGLAWVELPATAGDPARVVSTEERRIETPFVALHVHALAFDPGTHRLFAAISDVCSETRLRSRGLFALTFDGKGNLAFERPLLSTVRALATLDEALWVGMRDDNGGLACEGYPMTSGLARVVAGGAGTLNLLRPTGSDLIVPDAGVTAIDGTSESSLSIGTYRDGFYVGSTGGGLVGNPAFLGPSLFTTDVLWDEDAKTLWLAGKTSHSPGDPPQLADRGPRGAARLLVGESEVTLGAHYVRATDFEGPIAGLPSGEVMDLLWTPDGDVLMACATERVGTSDFDRADQPLFLVDGDPREGGVARVDAETDTITVLAGSDLVPDPRALAWDAAGRLLIADATRGLVRLEDGESGTATTPLPTPGLPDGAIPQSLWADGDDLALGTSKGAWIRWHGTTLILDDVGFVWDILSLGDHLALGTDAGLVLVREATTAPYTLPARAIAHEPPF
ncbi:MAG: hypothetical protein IT385_06400 [Deltaproteobacteria bacterium]|nr:hypothetical protein [Deltaproteobacteria bacterium]